MNLTYYIDTMINKFRIKRVFLIIIVIFNIFLNQSCLFSNIQETTTEKAAIPENFSWETMVIKEVEILNNNSVILNGKDQILANNLPLGTYSFAINSKDTLIAIQQTSITLSPSNSPLSIRKQDLNERYLFFPSENSYGTYLVEDLFPYKGDYDFNDIVFGYNFKYELTDDGNSVKCMVIKILPRAIGGISKTIGIGLKFYHKVKIESVQRDETDINKLFTPMLLNGTEENQNSCVVVPLVDNLRTLFASQDDFINTFANIPHISSTLTTITINFEKDSYPNYKKVIQHLSSSEEDSGVSLFIVIDTREKEIFTKENTPTDKFDKTLFSPTGRKNFSDSQNYVWAIQSTNNLLYSLEMVSISETYPLIDQWMFSGGVENENWFENPNTSVTYKE